MYKLSLVVFQLASLLLGHRHNWIDMRLYVFILFYSCTVYLTHVLSMLLLESKSNPNEQVCAFGSSEFCIYFSLPCLSIYVDTSGSFV